MIRLILLIVTLTLSLSTIANDELIKDWRLEKPFVHGFLGGITLNSVSLFPEKWSVAQHIEPNPIMPGTVKYLEQNKVVPFYFGVISGLLALGAILFYCFSAYKNRFVISHFKLAKTDHE
jgi:hypothetical protein